MSYSKTLTNLDRYEFKLIFGKYPVSDDLSQQQRRSIRRNLIKRDGKVCFYCGVELTDIVRDQQPIATCITIDHKIPRSDGGSNDLTNLVLACYKCNTEKGIDSFEDFVAKKGG